MSYTYCQWVSLSGVTCARRDAGDVKLPELYGGEVRSLCTEHAARWHKHLAAESKDLEWFRLSIAGRRIGECLTAEHALAEAATWARCTRQGVNVQHTSGAWSVWPSGEVERLR